MKPGCFAIQAGLSRTVLASLLATLLASCTSATDPQVELNSSHYSGAASLSAVDAEAGTVQEASGTEQAEAYAEPNKSLAAAVASKPDEKSPAQKVATNTATQLEIAAEPLNKAGAAENAPPVEASVQSAELVDRKKQAFLSGFFNNGSAAAPVVVGSVKRLADAQSSAGDTLPKEAAAKSKPIIDLDAAEKPILAKASTSMEWGNGTALPGVRQSALFEIKRKSGLDDNSDIDLNEDEVGGVQLASAGGMARLAPNGLLKQRETVDTACLKPGLVNVLRNAESHFGRKIMVTSGYRSPSYNKKVNGAKKSMHMFCAAADVQIAGVSKWELARYFRSLQGRGGVGTYCHTASVHVDLGPERDWNWRCSRRG